MFSTSSMSEALITQEERPENLTYIPDNITGPNTSATPEGHEAPEELQEENVDQEHENVVQEPIVVYVALEKDTNHIICVSTDFDRTVKNVKEAINRYVNEESSLTSSYIVDLQTNLENTVFKVTGIYRNWLFGRYPNVLRTFEIYERILN